MKEVLMEVGFLNLLMVMIETAKKSDHFLCLAFGLNLQKICLVTIIRSSVYSIPKERKWMQ